MSEPLSDEELAQIERNWWSLMTYAQTCPACKTVIISANEKAQNQTLPRLISEVRRFRSDEWLEKAVDEMWRIRPEEWMRPGYTPQAAMLAILRKHRDGKE